MKISDFVEAIKNEFEGWKPYELIILIGILLLIIANSFVVKDHPIAVFAAIFGILYTVFAGKGRFICFFFGVIGSFCYSYISYKNAVWGNLFLYLCYYVPMQILGIFQWKKNLQSENSNIVKTRLTTKELKIIIPLTLFVCAAAIVLLYYFHASSPVCDGITTVLSVLGMYLTVRRCIEQWIVWIIVNGLTALMWILLVINGANAYSAAIMWCVYFVMAFYFLFEWKNDIKN